MLGITGGSLYFLSENEAEKRNYTTTTNTSLIVCSCPLFATLLYVWSIAIFAYQHDTVLGSACFCRYDYRGAEWQIRAALRRRVPRLGFSCMYELGLSIVPHEIESGDYGAAFITRKVFFDGVLTILPYYLIIPGWPAWVCVYEPQVAGISCSWVSALMTRFLTWKLVYL